MDGLVLDSDFGPITGLSPTFTEYSRKSGKCQPVQAYE
jgi:hypothetical protein